MDHPPAIRVGRLIGLAGLLASPAYGASCALACTEIGCGSGASFERNIGNIEVGEEIIVTACRNDACNSGSCVVRKDPHRAEYCALSGPLKTACFVSGYAHTPDVRVRVHVESTAPNELHDGDHYTVQVSHSGVVLAEADTTVVYARHYPNGPDCDEVPCLGAEL